MQCLEISPFHVVVMLRESRQCCAERSFCVGIARAYIPPSNCVFLLSHLSHPLKNGAIWGESKGEMAVTNPLLLSHGEK